MGNQGDQMTNASVLAAEEIQERLQSLGDIRVKKMFGGHGVFESDAMFSLIDKNGAIYFKVDESNLDRYQEAGAVKHGRMPYYRVPDPVLNNNTTLLEWALVSIHIAREAK